MSHLFFSPGLVQYHQNIFNKLKLYMFSPIREGIDWNGQKFFSLIRYCSHFLFKIIHTPRLVKVVIGIFVINSWNFKCSTHLASFFIFIIIFFFCVWLKCHFFTYFLLFSKEKNFLSNLADEQTNFLQLFFFSIRNMTWIMD